MKQLKFITKLRGLIVLVLALMVSGNAWSAGWTPVTSITSGNSYYLSDGTNYVTLSGSTLSTTTAASSATLWTFTTSGTGYTIKSGNYYLRVTNKNSTTSLEASSSDSKNVWTYTSDGKLQNQNSTSYYITISSGSVSVTTSGTSNLVGTYSTVTTYSVTLPTSLTGGSITASSTSGLSGDGTETITLTPTASTGYKLSTLTVTDASSNTVATTDNGDGTYSFTMPASNVTVAASFIVNVPTDRPYALKVTGLDYYVDFETTYAATDKNDCATMNSNIYPFIFAASTDGTYTIQSGVTGAYMAPGYDNREGDEYDPTDLAWSTVLSATSWNWIFAPNGSAYTIARAASNYLGPQATASGSAVYSNNSSADYSYTLVPMYFTRTVDEAGTGTITNGTVTHSYATGYGVAAAGQTVTLTATPDDGYELDSYTITYVDGDGNTQTITPTISGTTATFTMPAGDVVVDATFVSTATLADPVFTPGSTSFTTQSMTFEITTSVEGGVIYYTTDGSTPSTTNGTQYEGTITVTESTTFKAIVYKDDEHSKVVTETYDHPYAISVSPSSVRLKEVDETSQLTVTAASGYDGTVTFESSNASVATVSSTGLITAVGNGTATITVTPGNVTDKYYNYEAKTITVTVASGYKPSAYSTSWTTSNQVYLYNKATGLYLGSGGHWGTEGYLKSTGLPFYMGTAASDKSDVTGVSVYSSSDRTSDDAYKHLVGYQSSAQVFGIENHGLYIDAGTNYPNQTFSFYYNSDDESYSIVPDAMETGVAIYYKPSTAVTLYLTPGASQALSWATVPYYWTMNSSNQIYTVYGSAHSGLGTSYYLTGSSSGLTMTTSASDCDITGTYLKIGDYYLTGGGTDMTSESSDASAQFTVYEQNETYKFYLEQNGGTSEARQNVVTCTREKIADIPDEARWFVVTKADLLADFSKATEEGSTSKEATFLLANPDFSREVDQGWTFSTTATDYTTGYIRIGNSLFNYASPTTTINNANNSIEDENDDSKVGTSTTDATYGGNGSGYELDATDATYANLPEGTSTYYNIPYGGYYNCRILGESGTISQVIADIPEAGYYRISCDAYVYNPSSASGTATLWAYQDGQTTAGKYNVSTQIMDDEDGYQDMTAAGITFANNDNYRQSVLVYLDKGATLNLGVTLTGGTLGTVATSNTNTFVEIDEVKIQYAGAPEFDIILDETAASTNVDGTSLNYINAQVADGARTMYLQRSMTAGKWNSLVLPVNVTVESLQGAFGGGVKLVEFDECDGNLIKFKDVDLSDESATAMKAGYCYLVKPSALNNITGTYSTTYAKATSKSIEISTEKGVTTPIFSFSQITLNKAVDPDPFVDDEKAFMPTTNRTDKTYEYGLCFMGTYFDVAGAMTYGSYALNAKDGYNWNRYTGTGLEVKGFRCWIGQQEGTTIPSAQAKFITVINGEVMDATDIAGVEADEPTTISDNRVYNISGQFVGTADNMNKLPKGIYITNGKKYIVK